jgi:hypothetical protein
MVILSLESLNFGNSHDIIKQSCPLDSKYLPIIHYIENDSFEINGLSVFFVREKESKFDEKSNCIPLQNLPSILSVIGNISDKSPYFLNFCHSLYDFSTSSSVIIPYSSSSIVSPFKIEGKLARLLDGNDMSGEYSKVFIIIMNLMYFL